MNAHIQTPSSPYYVANGNECALFDAAQENGLPLLLKGPTGCGKTRFVEHMAARLGRRLYTVACHDDLSAADLIGRYLLCGVKVRSFILMRLWRRAKTSPLCCIR